MDRGGVLYLAVGIANHFVFEVVGNSVFGELDGSFAWKIGEEDFFVCFVAVVVDDIFGGGEGLYDEVLLAGGGVSLDA